MSHRNLSLYLAAGAAACAAVAPFLPDTTTGSPRSVALALAAGLAAVAVVLRGGETHGEESKPPA